MSIFFFKNVNLIGGVIIGTVGREFEPQSSQNKDLHH